MPIEVRCVRYTNNSEAIQSTVPVPNADCIVQWTGDNDGWAIVLKGGKVVARFLLSTIGQEAIYHTKATIPEIEKGQSPNSMNREVHIKRI